MRVGELLLMMLIPRFNKDARMEMEVLIWDAWVR